MPGSPAIEGVYGLARLACVTIALPVSALREAVACPPQLSPLPFPCPSLAGALDLRGEVLPVLDLRTHLGIEPGRPADSIVLVIGKDERRVGVLADAVMGIRRPAAGDVQPVDVVGGQRLVSHVFQDSDDGPISVLDAQSLMALPDLPSVRERRPAAGVGAGGSAAGQVRRLAILRCGPHTIAVETTVVHTILPAGPCDRRPYAAR